MDAPQFIAGVEWMGLCIRGAKMGTYGEYLDKLLRKEKKKEERKIDSVSKSVSQKTNQSVMKGRFLLVVTFNSNNEKLLREIVGKVLAKADAELKPEIGRWFVSLDKVTYGSKLEGVPVATLHIAVEGPPDLSRMNKIKDTLIRWWRYYAKIYEVYDY